MSRQIDPDMLPWSDIADAARTDPERFAALMQEATSKHVADLAEMRVTAHVSCTDGFVTKLSVPAWPYVATTDVLETLMSAAIQVWGGDGCDGSGFTFNAETQTYEVVPNTAARECWERSRRSWELTGDDFGSFGMVAPT